MSRYEWARRYGVLFGSGVKFNGAAHPLQSFLVLAFGDSNPGRNFLDLDFGLPCPVTLIDGEHCFTERLQPLDLLACCFDIAIARCTQSACKDKHGLCLRELIPDQIRWV